METNHLLLDDVGCNATRPDATTLLNDNFNVQCSSPGEPLQCNHRFVNYGPLAYCTECGLEGVYLGRV